MSDNTHTWRDAVADAHTAAAEAFAYAVANDEYLDGGAEWDAAHEWADGSEWVIYTHRARCLWMDSTEVQDEEDEIRKMSSGTESVDYVISACVFRALAAEFAEHWRTLAEAHADAEEVEA